MSDLAAHLRRSLRLERARLHRPSAFRAAAANPSEILKNLSASSPAFAGSLTRVVFIFSLTPFAASIGLGWPSG
jgi:hypothetical protein